MSDTADMKTTQAASVVQVIAQTLRSAVRAGWDGRIISTPFAAATIMVALDEAGYVIVPASAVDTALGRKDAAG